MFAALTVPMVAMDEKNEPTEMPIDAIRVVGNVRDEVGDVTELAATIREHGVIEPIIVTPDGKLIAGQRRLAAARAAGLTHVPVRVRDVRDPRVALEIGLIENVQRRELDPLSRARAYHALIHEHGVKVDAVARMVGQGAVHVYQYLQLLVLHPDAQRALREERISFADARELAPLAQADQRAVLAEILSMSKRPTSRQVKQLVKTQRALAAARRQSMPATDATGEDMYGALFADAERANATSAAPAVADVKSDPASDLGAIIAEMLEAAQGEDQLRAWARRLSHIAESLRARGG